MKLSSITISALVGIVVAAPAADLARRQTTANDIKSGACKKITLVFARASTEPGNMVSSLPMRGSPSKMLIRSLLGNEYGPNRLLWTQVKVRCW
jgi:cutinase